MPRFVRFLIDAAIYFCLGLVLWVHAILQDSNPSPRGIVTGPQVPIRLRFNSRIDAPRCRLYVEKGGNIRQIPIATQTAADTLNGQVLNLTPGEYSIRWQVLAVDGHITRGEYPFSVR